MENVNQGEQESRSPEEELFEEYRDFLLEHGEFTPEPAIPGCYHFVFDRNRIPTTNPDVPVSATFMPAYVDEGELSGDYLSIHFPTDELGIKKIVTFYRLDGGLSVDVDYDVPTETDEQYLRRLSIRMERAHWGPKEMREWMEGYFAEDQAAGIDDVELARRALIASRQHFS